MRNLLFVLVFISITVLGCGNNKSPLEDCADEFSGASEEFLKKSLKEKLQDDNYYIHHHLCEQLREKSPKTFDAKYQ